VPFALDVDDVHRPGLSSEAHDVKPGPVPVLASDGIVSDPAFVPVDAGRRHVQVDPRVACGVRVEVGDDDDVIPGV
jgi:hypothetical protein